MLYLYGLEQQLETILLLAKCRDHSFTFTTLQHTKVAYLGFLKDIQPEVSNPQALLTTNSNDVNLQIFNASSPFNDIPHQLITRARHSKDFLCDDDERLSWTDRALKSIFETNRDFKLLFGLAINNVFVAPCKTAVGGTSSRAIGVIWIYPQVYWTVNDFFEFFVHELAHTLLFLDEWRYTHYSDIERLSIRKNYAISAIQCSLRPLDKVLHSIVIAAEILLFRMLIIGCKEKTSIHPCSADLVGGLQQSVDCVLSMPDARELLSPRSFELIQASSHIAARAATSLASL